MNGFKASLKAELKLIVAKKIEKMKFEQ